MHIFVTVPVLMFSLFETLACPAEQVLAGGGRCVVLISRGGMLAKHELAALAATGASLFVVRADAGNATAMAHVLAWARERLTGRERIRPCGWRACQGEAPGIFQHAQPICLSTLLNICRCLHKATNYCMLALPLIHVPVL